ncbi:MAG: hypothetical protein A2243_02135 [Omnitrophica WOR_2 bacterium RIFOXYA2_FULL_38_17]|nr:MAG: hypothetical protein A2243_02135 [Omnitrophica WOR_2 bacterium RIFOXYA2_FULL_38_17]OGX54501.1 MAG: hypothetical protein A2267_06710 [Omnitrophica WOR_2 bacterium RIFOXYA12_FULL_38_10]HBG62014.1 hypothetical protein [Candidatus Omnitrophota bacterium]
MKKKVILGIIAGVIVLAGIIASLQTYSQKVLQSRVRDASVYLNKEAVVASQYEPYYLDTASQAPVPTKAIDKQGEAVVPRKIIRSASMDLKVKDCEEAGASIRMLAQKNNGYVVNSNIYRNSDGSKYGHTEIKVPPSNFFGVLTLLKGVGEVNNESINGEDVTEEFVDLQARLNNSIKVRDRLYRILDEQAREVKDILEVERELARLGEKIETIEGRMKFINRKVDLATITVSYSEPRSLVLGTFDVKNRFVETIRTAIEAFINVSNGIIIVLSALAPVVVWALLIWAVIVGITKARKKK